MVRETFVNKIFENPKESPNGFQDLPFSASFHLNVLQIHILIYLFSLICVYNFILSNSQK